MSQSSYRKTTGKMAKYIRFCHLMRIISKHGEEAIKLFARRRYS
jgi:hypothetical protein